ncbi:unnamed protein product [Cyclocybe aegerita]|uniref:Uncharacterized protein n=1 Tax=Cyclocybe aegerita TaxID=1973307 RepID=A0A8S0WI08_CYCAE|nr:unnamed protein product [Cyclocybe aegerita]
MISTPQVFLDALRHGYTLMGSDISLLVFDEAYHAVDKYPCKFYRKQDSGKCTPDDAGNVEKAFRTVESNFKSGIRLPRRNHEEIAQYVHRRLQTRRVHPVRRRLFREPRSIICGPQNNEYRKRSLREIQLSRAALGSPEYERIDQKLSKVIEKESSFTHT